MKTLLHNECIHAFATLLVASIFYYFSQNTAQTLLLMAVSIGIDIDHLIDYVLYLHTQNHKPDLRFFLSVKYFLLSNKLYVLLHSWELVLVFLWLYRGGNGTIFLSIAAGMITHYAIDTVTNHMHPLAYVFTFRAIHKFDLLCTRK